MQDAVPVGQGAMAAVTKQDAETVQALCDEVEGYVIPVNYNCPGQIVVSGENDAVDRLIELAKSRKIRTVKLAVSAPFHCAMMNPASEKLAEAFRTISFGKPEIPCYSNVDAKPYGENTDAAAQLCLQAKSPVLWEQTLRNLAADGFDTFVEVGPGTTLSKFVAKTLGEEVKIYSVNSLEGLQQCREGLEA
jgi:[acyl-carrier-protein] S-malonyltransferase